MYLPKVFTGSEADDWRALAEARSFGTIVVAGPDGTPEIGHLPFLIEPGKPYAKLRAHVAGANPLAGMLDARPRATVVFHGPHAYVTPRWYEAPRDQVPTWNFAVVHLRGVARPVDDPLDVRRALADFAAKYESDAKEPWSLDRIDPARLDELIAAIRAFEIDVDGVEAKWKMSQNRSEADQRRVIHGLVGRAQGDDLAVAEVMRNKLRG